MENKSQSMWMLETVATFAPNDVNLLASKYGYYWPDNTDESRMSFLAALWEDKGDGILADIASIHPDRKLIIAAYQDKQKRKNKKVKITSAADGSQSIVPQVATNKGFTARENLLIMILITIVIALFIKSK